MSKSLPLWLTKGLNLPGWKLWVIQWLVLGALILLFGLLLLQDKWQQLGQAQAEQQRLAQHISPLWAQLARMPTLEAVSQRLQQLAPQQVADDELSDVLQLVGAGLQRWQQQENSSRQTLWLQLDYGSLLRLLERLPARLRIDQMAVEAQTKGLAVHFTLQRDVSAEVAAVNPHE
ncbi:hypothetical protein [Serratia quinivorans]|uniref:hypothetical protein n=1 Tax=Serratia quinivorans TaxID=137545 RepID=UPI003F94CE0E